MGLAVVAMVIGGVTVVGAGATDPLPEADCDEDPEGCTFFADDLVVCEQAREVAEELVDGKAEDAVDAQPIAPAVEERDLGAGVVLGERAKTTEIGRVNAARVLDLDREEDLAAVDDEVDLVARLRAPEVERRVTPRIVDPGAQSCATRPSRAAPAISSGWSSGPAGCAARKTPTSNQ